MSFWPFSKRKASEQPTAPRDARNWNEDWRVGDTAECIATEWSDKVPPWERPAVGARFIVVGFAEGLDRDKRLRYFLRLEGWPIGVSTTAFRKVRPVATEQSEVVQRILKAKPGADRKRVEA